jgi:hypothetical protein
VNRVEQAGELFERIKHSDGIGHILAHRREAYVNTDPRMANAWQNKTTGSIYAAPSWELESDSVAERLTGEEPV